MKNCRRFDGLTLTRGERQGEMRDEGKR